MRRVPSAPTGPGRFGGCVGGGAAAPAPGPRDQYSRGAQASRKARLRAFRGARTHLESLTSFDFEPTVFARPRWAAPDRVGIDRALLSSVAFKAYSLNQCFATNIFDTSTAYGRSVLYCF